MGGSRFATADPETLRDGRWSEGSRDTLRPILGIEPHKNIENRSWPTNYRGPVLIHASLKIDKQPCVGHGLDPTKLETGGVVG